MALKADPLARKETIGYCELILFFVGLVFLVAGAEGLVSGGSRLASAMGISPLIIGLTVLSFGTSSPELAVSVLAGLSGQGDISLGNMLGEQFKTQMYAKRQQLAPEQSDPHFSKKRTVYSEWK